MFKMNMYDWTCSVVLWTLVTPFVQAYMELPKFSQLKLLYPGYYQHGGRYRDKDIIDMIGGNIFGLHTHNTASLRMSWALNKFGGRHSIGKEPIFLSKKGRDSITGKDDVEYIYRNTAFGPFLASRYGNPLVARPNKHDHKQTMNPFQGKQGIVRLVSYHRNQNHASGHIGLWDCSHFYLSQDWTTEHHLISVEFWETPDSYCPPAVHDTPAPKLQPVNLDNVQIIARHNFNSGYLHPKDGREPRKEKQLIRMRHSKKPKEQVWTQ